MCALREFNLVHFSVRFYLARLRERLIDFFDLAAEKYEQEQQEKEKEQEPQKGKDKDKEKETESSEADFATLGKRKPGRGKSWPGDRSEMLELFFAARDLLTLANTLKDPTW